MLNYSVKIVVFYVLSMIFFLIYVCFVKILSMEIGVIRNVYIIVNYVIYGMVCVIDVNIIIRDKIV